MTEPFKKKMDNPTFSLQKVRFCQLIMAAIACLLLIPLSAFAQNNKDAAQQTNATTITNRWWAYRWPTKTVKWWP